jgi:hypothetical protein
MREQQTTTYRVTAITGTQHRAGTDARVYLTMYGDQGTSGERELDNFADNFENGQIDTFSVTMKDIGEIHRVLIRHDNTGSRPGWFLEGIRIHNETNNREWYFPCKRWLSRGNDDGQNDCSSPRNSIPGPWVPRPPRLTEETAESPLRGDPHGVFGERPGNRTDTNSGTAPRPTLTRRDATGAVRRVDPNRAVGGRSQKHRSLFRRRSSTRKSYLVA